MLDIQLLGPVEAFIDDAPLPLGGPKQRTVLAVLAVDPEKRVSVDRLTEAVWGDEVPERASRSISTFVSNLRGVLGDVIVRDGNGYVLQVGCDQVDATRFADRIAVGQGSDPATRAEELRDAIKSWVGTPFGGVDGHHILEPEITRLTELKIAATESAIEAEFAAGGDVDLIELDRLIVEHPHRERIRGLHMRALYSAGRQAEALTSYKSFRDQLATDLGIDPSPELQQLELQILQQDPTLSPERPSPAALDVGSLPVRYSSFVGRADEIAAVSAAVATDRLVTVVGPGGIGKSSLVVEAARSPDVHRGQTVVRVVIDALGDGEVVPALAAGFGLSPAPGVDPIDVIAGYASTRSFLLILDGCEPHLEVASDVINRVLSSSPDARVLATSREPLGLAGEAVIRTGGLDTDAAVELFIDRAKLDTGMAGESLERMRDVCVALDGMPLAIELAAARTRSVFLDRLVERLDDMIPLLAKSRTSGGRHGSIAAAMAWSYDLLEPQERRAFRWLSVFPIGFTHTDAEAVLDDRYAEDVLSRLVDVSLVQPADQSGRYRMLEPVRQYAEHLLKECGESDTARRQQALWIAAEANRVDQEMWSPKFHEALTWLIERSSEVGQTMEWAVAHGAPEIAIDILCATGERLAVYGDPSAYLDRATAAVSHPAAVQNGRLAMAMVETAAIAANAHRPDEAFAILDRAQAVAEAADHNEAKGMAIAVRAGLMNLAFASRPEHLDEMDEAIRLMKQAGSIRAKILLLRRAIILARMGQMDEAVAGIVAYEAWATSRRGRPEWNTIGWKGRLARLSGDRRTASGFDRDLTEVAHANLDFHLEQSMWESVAVDATVLGDRPLMVEAVDRSRDLAERTGVPLRAFAEARVESALGHHDNVLAVAKHWFNRINEQKGRSESAEAFVIGYAVAGDATREPDFFEILLPVALALEATGRIDETQRIAREAPSLMAQSNFKHWDELGETARWAELLERLGGGKPEGLSLEAAFDMVHGMLAGDPT